jgi:hypothetical protein
MKCRHDPAALRNGGGSSGIKSETDALARMPAAVTASLNALGEIRICADQPAR